MNLKPWIKALLIAFLLALFTRNFIIETYSVNSENSEPYFSKNETVWLNKLKFGGRFPITPISLPFVQDKIPFTNLQSYLSSFEMPYFRIFGFSSIKKTDFLVFNNPLQTKLPIDRRKILMSKCFALAGDTLKIQKNNLYVNRRKEFTLKAKNKIRIWLSPKDSIKIKEEYNLELNNLVNYTGGFLINSNSKLAQKAKKDSLIKIFDLNTPIDKVRELAKSNFFKKNGLIVPKKDMKIQLNSQNFVYLKPIIEKYEKVEISINKKNLFIDGIKTREYAFKQDYYFVITNPGRVNEMVKWLLVPENHIIGLIN